MKIPTKFVNLVEHIFMLIFGITFSPTTKHNATRYVNVNTCYKHCFVFLGLDSLDFLIGGCCLAGYIVFIGAYSAYLRIKIKKEKSNKYHNWLRRYNEYLKIFRNAGRS